MAPNSRRISRSARHQLFLVSALLLSTVSAFSTFFMSHTIKRTSFVRFASDETENETQDERLNRMLRERIEELGMVDDNKAKDLPSPQEASQAPSLQFRISSLEILAMVVSAFFIATVILSDGALFASPSTTSSTSRVVLDADEILQQDFSRDASSVIFGSSEDDK